MSKILSGAEMICEALITEGVEVIFGYPGGAIMPVYDALLRYPQLRHILVRHEQGAGHAAEGYAWVTGKPGVCLVTSGPGATNLVTPITDAMMDSVPLVCISGQVPSQLIGTDAFQEADIVGITATITKHNYLVTDVKQIGPVFKEAFHLAKTGRPGPVVIDVAKNAQFSRAKFSYPKETVLPGYKPTLHGNPIQIKKAAAVINRAKKPQIIAGHGVMISHAEKELKQLAEKGDIPVSVTHLGLSTFPSSHRLFVGVVGMHGNYAPNLCSQEADVLIAIGMRFHDRVTGRLADYASNAQIIHIDIDPAETSKNIFAHYPIVGDARRVLQQLNKFIEKKERRHWLKKFRDYYQVEKRKVIDRQVFRPQGELKMGEIVHTLSELTKEQAIVVSDVGQNQMAAMRYYQFSKPRSHVTSGGLGTMGFSLPAGIGAKVGQPDREVWIVIGDGGIQMTLQELATVAQEDVAVKIALLNNNYLGMVRQWQELFFDRRYSEVHLKNPDFIRLAEGFGIPATKVKKRDEVKKAIEEARKTAGPYLIEFVCQKEENVFPMISAGASVSEMRLE